MSFMHILNEQTRETLSRKLGKTYDEILQMSAEDIEECRLGWQDCGPVWLWRQRVLP
jgi:hypothetical protein